MRLQRIPEEDHEVEPPFDTSGANLLIPAERPTQEPHHRQSELIREQCATRSGHVQVVRGCVPRLNRAQSSSSVLQLSFASVPRMAMLAR